MALFTHGSVAAQTESTDSVAAMPVENPVTDSRIIHRTLMVGAGSVNILDTYLSPEKYRGTEFRFVSHTSRPTRCKGFSQILIHQGNMSLSDNRADNNSEIAGTYNFQYAWRYNWDFLANRLHVEAGAGADLLLGFLYNTRNGNNPAQAKAAVNIAPSAAVAYCFTAWKRPFVLRYEASVPLVGVMFSPHFGQSYYEIFNEGNYDHNVVATTFATTPSLRQMVGIDFSLWHTWFRVAYLADWQQSDVNSIKYHSYSNMIMIGITRHFSITKYRP